MFRQIGSAGSAHPVVCGEALVRLIGEHLMNSVELWGICLFVVTKLHEPFAARPAARRNLQHESVRYVSVVRYEGRLYMDSRRGRDAVKRILAFTRGQRSPGRCGMSRACSLSFRS